MAGGMVMKCRLLVPLVFAAFFLLVQQIFCLPQEPSAQSSQAGAQTQVPTNELVGKWRSLLTSSDDYDELVLGQDGTVQHTVHYESNSDKYIVSANVPKSAAGYDAVETGWWMLINGVIEFAFPDADKAHPTLMRGVQTTSSELEMRYSCCWVSSKAPKYVCDQVIRTYKKLDASNAPPRTPEIKAASPQTLASPLKVVRQISPQFPPEALAKQIQGEVLVEAVVAENGSVERVRVLRSTNRIFQKAALESMIQWQFTNPIDSAGKPTRVLWPVKIVFRFR
jgi:TonB family protein